MDFKNPICYNDGMRYCISDIHGYYNAFCELMNKIKFGQSDKLYVLGDAIDKGPDSIRLAQLLFSLPNVQYIAGNHEYDFIKFYKKRMMEVSSNYDEVLFEMQGYFPDGKLLDWETLDNFEYLPFYIDEKDFIGVHAGALLKGGKVCPLASTPNEIFVYDRTFKDRDVLPTDSKCVLFGHTPVRNLTGNDEMLLYRRNGLFGGSTDIKDYCKIHIDTGVYLSGTLGCICLDTCQCFYVKGVKL